MEDSPLLKQLQPQQQLALTLYMKSMNKSQAAREAGYGSPHVFNAPSMKAAIAEQMTIRAERLRVGADWVLGQAVKVYHRCMQMELVTVLDNDGLPEGRYQFDGRGAIQALTLVGKHVDVKAFDLPLDARADDAAILERLQRGRQRMADSDDDFLDDEEESQVELPNFLELLTDDSPVEQLKAPDEQLKAPDEQLKAPDEQLKAPDEQQEVSSEYDSEVVHEIEPTARK